VPYVPTQNFKRLIIKKQEGKTKRGKGVRQHHPWRGVGWGAIERH